MSDTAEITRYFALDCPQSSMRYWVAYTGAPEQVGALPDKIESITCVGCLGVHSAPEVTKEQYEAAQDLDDEEPIEELRVSTEDRDG